MKSILLWIIASSILFAQEPTDRTIGFRTGVNVTENKQGFRQYELFTNRYLPYKWNWSIFPSIVPRVEASVAALTRENDFGLITSVGPGLEFLFLQGQIGFDLGISAALITRDEYTTTELGGPIHFISHIGTRFHITEQIAISYRFQHMSNAGIDEVNPGLNLSIFELTYRLF
jgi:hypothetical protein